jgi:hypothetical protein
MIRFERRRLRAIREELSRARAVRDAPAVVPKAVMTASKGRTVR